MVLRKSWLRPIPLNDDTGFVPVDQVAATRPLIYIRPEDIPGTGWTSGDVWPNRGTDVTVPGLDVGGGNLPLSIPIPQGQAVRFSSIGQSLSTVSTWPMPSNLLLAMWIRFIFPTTRDYQAGVSNGAPAQARTGVSSAAFPELATNGGVYFTWADFTSSAALVVHFLKLSTTEGQWWESGVEHTPRPAGDYSPQNNGFLLQPNDLADFGALAIWDGDAVDETTARTAFESQY